MITNKKNDYKMTDILTLTERVLTVRKKMVKCNVLLSFAAENRLKTFKKTRDQNTEAIVGAFGAVIIFHRLYLSKLSARNTSVR